MLYLLVLNLGCMHNNFRPNQLFELFFLYCPGEISFNSFMGAGHSFKALKGRFSLVLYVPSSSQC